MKLTENEKKLLRVRLNLSERQAEIVELLLEGETTRAGMAKKMGISVGTVTAYLHDIYLKTHKPTKLDLALFALHEIGAIRAD